MKFTRLPFLIAALSVSALAAQAQTSTHTYTSVDAYGNVRTETVQTPIADAQGIGSVIARQNMLGNNSTSSSFSYGSSYGSSYGGLTSSYCPPGYGYGYSYGGTYPNGGSNSYYSPPGYGYGYNGVTVLPYGGTYLPGQSNYFPPNYNYFPPLIVGNRANTGGRAISGQLPRGTYSGRNDMTPTTILPGFSNSYTSNLSRRR